MSATAGTAMATELNPQFAWKRIANGDRALYVRKDTQQGTLQEPAEGVKAEKAIPDELFEAAYAQLRIPHAVWEDKRRVIREKLGLHR